jgi:micrococcal nuclease
MDASNFYLYEAYVTSVYDGDTITCDVDLGFGIVFKKQKIRLYGINTPELRGDEREDGLKARDYLREKILDKKIILETKKDKKGKFGRFLGIVHIDGTNINNHLIEQKLAVKYT